MEIRIQVMKQKGKDTFVSLYDSIANLSPKMVKQHDGTPGIYRPGRKEVTKGDITFIAPDRINDDSFRFGVEMAEMLLKNRKTKWKDIGPGLREYNCKLY